VSGVSSHNTHPAKNSTRQEGGESFICSAQSKKKITERVTIDHTHTPTGGEATERDRSFSYSRQQQPQHERAATEPPSQYKKTDE